MKQTLLNKVSLFEKVGLDVVKGGGIPRSGLIGEWTFSGNPNDTSGSGHNGTVTGATLTTDRHSVANSAYDFNGTSDFIQLLGTFPDIGTTDFSVSAWFRSGNLTNQGSIIAFKEDFATTGFAITQDTSGTNHIDVRLNGVQFQLNLATVLDTWYHIVVTSDRDGNMSAYIDSVFDSLVDISSAGTFALTKKPAFGVRNDFPSVSFFDGKIDDIRIYNRILTQIEINQLFAE